MSTELAVSLACDPLPPSTYGSNVITTGTAAVDPGAVYLNPSFTGCPYITFYSGVRWVHETYDRIPVLFRPTSSHFLVWWDVDASHPWTTLDFYGVGTGSVACASRPSAKSAGRMRADNLAHIQAALGFTLQDLALVLGISRAQLYKWLDPDREIQLHEESRNRLKQIAQLASEWRKLSSAPLSDFAHEPIFEGASIVSLMAEPTLDVNNLMGVLHFLAEVKRQPSVTEMLRQRGFRRRPSARSLRSDE